MSQDFRYPSIPLDRELSYIRLLTLRHGESSLIECDLEVYSISNCPAFTALSYVWGPPEIGHAILLDGKEFRVRTNLYDALQAILYQRSKATDNLLSSGVDIDRPETWKYFWIDAVCIDQNNILERNHQVGLMKQIYSNARFVLTWLGEASAEEERGMMEFSAKNYHGWNDYESGRFLDLLNQLFEKEYWTRMWIIQEIVLAQDILLMCGSQTLKWKVVSSWFTTPYAKASLTGGGAGFLSSEGYGILNLTERRSWFGGHRQKTLPFGDLLIHTCLQKCSDPRDCVYGLLGLLESHDSDALQVDYSLTQEQLFERVTEHFAHMYPFEDERRKGTIRRALELGLNVSKTFADTCFDKWMPTTDELLF